MRKFMAILLGLMLAGMASVALSEIRAPYGEGQIGYMAVVICEKLTVRESQNTASKAVTRLNFGDWFITQQNAGGWCDVFLNETDGPTGYVLSDYVLIDPSRYVTDASTVVYAWDDVQAKKVGMLATGTELPIIRETEDWVLVSLRGASGWIKKTDMDKVTSVYEMRNLSNLSHAQLIARQGTFTLTSPESLQWLAENFSYHSPVGAVNCPFEATLILTKMDGTVIQLQIATDGCHHFRTQNGVCYSFGNVEEALDKYGSENAISDQFWGLFGLETGWG